MQSNIDNFEAAGATVIMVVKDSKADMKQQMETAHKLKPYYGIAEPNHEIGKLYKQKTGQGDLLPAQFIIDTDGVIKLVNYGDGMAGWVEPKVLLEELNKL